MSVHPAAEVSVGRRRVDDPQANRDAVVRRGRWPVRAVVGSGRSCAADGDHQGSAVAVRLAVRSWEPAGQPRHRGSCLADHRSGAVSVVAAWTGRVHRPNHPNVHIGVVQLGKTSGSPRCSEPTTLRAARVVLAYRKARTRLPARSSTRGAGRRVRSAVGECLIGRPEDQRGARTARGQGEQVAQGAAVAQLVTVPGSGEEVADLDAACPLAPASGQARRRGCPAHSRSRTEAPGSLLGLRRWDPSRRRAGRRCLTE
jgi:hypothetical protein